MQIHNPYIIVALFYLDQCRDECRLANCSTQSWRNAYLICNRFSCWLNLNGLSNTNYIQYPVSNTLVILFRWRVSHRHGFRCINAIALDKNSIFHDLLYNMTKMVDYFSCSFASYWHLVLLIFTLIYVDNGTLKFEITIEGDYLLAGREIHQWLLDNDNDNEYIFIAMHYIKNAEFHAESLIIIGTIWDIVHQRVIHGQRG